MSAVGRVANKIALVTGAAAGIGKAIGVTLAREGATVYFADLNEDLGSKAVDEVTNSGGKAHFVNLNTASEDAWKKVTTAIGDKYGRLDITVNNAGVLFEGNIEDTTLDKWRWLNSINTEGVFLGTKYSIPLMKPQKKGSIINLSSIEGYIGDPQLTAYNASKGAVRIFSKSAALHCAKLGIRINTLHPGFIWTPMIQKYCDESAEAAEAQKRLASLHPVGHLGEPEDIANGALFLASDESKFMTGAELLIDGGYTAQ